MRQILFRGKHIHTLPQNEHLDGTWIEGYLCDENYIHSPVLEGEFLIDPETVCQYIGLTDKNGRKMFEGDIIKVCTFGFEPELFTTEIIYDNCAFRLKNGRTMFDCGQSDFTKMADATVIGNIFDNPELIQKETLL